MKKNTISIYILLMMGFLNTTSIHAQVFKTQEVALAEAFATADTVTRHTLFLDDDQVSALQKQSRSEFTDQIISYYVGKKAGQITGYAFFENQTVRTKQAITMVLVSPQGAVQTVEVLAFYEPSDYLPTPRWFKLFTEKILSAQLWPGKSIHVVTGATLSVRAFTASTRRALSLFHHLTENPS